MLLSMGRNLLCLELVSLICKYFSCSTRRYGAKYLVKKPT
ncbi:hypothetical protein X975_26287, partial [Stegodyphus mimosarum]